MLARPPRANYAWARLARLGIHPAHPRTPLHMPAKEPREYSLAVAQALAHSALLQFGERAAAVALSKSAWGTGLGMRPAATSPAMWAMSTSKKAETEFAISANLA